MIADQLKLIRHRLEHPRHGDANVRYLFFDPQIQTSSVPLPFHDSGDAIL